MVKPAKLMVLALEAAPGGGDATAERPIDLVHLSRQTFGDHDLERELLALFDAQAAQFARRLDEPIAAEETVWRVELVHTLKGSSRAIGAFQVGRAAEAYEQALRAGDRVASAPRERLSAAIETARGAIAQLLARL